MPEPGKRVNVFDVIDSSNRLHESIEANAEPSVRLITEPPQL